MEWAIQYSAEEGFVRVTTKGVFNLDDHLIMIKDILAQDYWRPGRAILFDHRKLDFGKIGYDVMKKAGLNHEKYDEQIGDGQTAILMKAASDFGLGRQFEMLTDDRISAKLCIFLDEEEAVRWLRAQNYQIP